MIRRCLLAVSALGLGIALGAGCGAMMVAAQKGEPVWLLHRLDYTVYQPSHRVALATFEALRAELKDVKVLEIEVSRDTRYNTPEGKMPRPGDVHIPDEYPAFWMDGLDSGGPILVNCRYCDFEGMTKDGKRVEAVVRLEIAGSDQRTVVSVQVGRNRDDKATKDLITKISDRVHEPRLKPGSAEEQASLNVIFGHRPGTDGLKVLDSGDLRITKN